MSAYVANTVRVNGDSGVVKRGPPKQAVAPSWSRDASGDPGPLFGSMGRSKRGSVGASFRRTRQVRPGSSLVTVAPAPCLKESVGGLPGTGKDGLFQPEGSVSGRLRSLAECTF